MPSKSSASSIASSWKQIEGWMHDNWEGEHCLPPSATTQDIQQAEAALGQSLPKQVCDCYAIHNGSGAITLFPLGNVMFPLMSLADSVGIWRSIQKTVARGSYDYPEFANHPVGPIRKAWLHPSWVPLVHDHSGDYLFVDLSPARGGKRGQIIEFSRDEGANRVLAHSVGELLAEIAAELVSGRYFYDKKKQALSRVV